MPHLKGVCELRGSWRGMLYKLTHPNAVGCAFQVVPRLFPAPLQPPAAKCPDAAAAQLG
jgi:hypothetical protein